MLLDTYAWVEFFKGTGKGEKVKELLRKNACFSSAISLAELSEWIEREGIERDKVIPVVKKLSSIIEVDQQTFELAGIIKVKKRETAKGFGLIDAIILATARQYNLKLVTGDKHFQGENTLIL
ncbi:MAG: PIN domain-containing protein [Candidatus Diapherotrites archaeon]